MSSDESTLPSEIGRYRIIRALGRGAMGRVLLAHDPVLDRDVAVKLLRDDLGIPADQRRTLLDRMRQEARASARVGHPNIVALHDMGEDPNLGLFLVFEYLAGETLKERLERGPLGPVAAARLARELGGALSTAHDAGVLHRDVKPENVILSKTGAKVADFGIARVPDSTLTLGGGLLGTPAYSAPESIADGHFSPASDQFSMATTLYEAISGRRAFPGDDAVAVASRISTEEPPKIAQVCGVDPHVDTILARGLSKNPRSRFSSCQDFGRGLGEALEISPRTTMATLPDEVHREAAERRQNGAKAARAAAGGMAIGAMLTIVAFQLTAQLRGEKPTDPLPEVEPMASATAEADAMPVAWLAEKPPDPEVKKASPSPAPSSETLPADGGSGPRDAGPSARAADASTIRPDAARRAPDASRTSATR